MPVGESVSGFACCRNFLPFLGASASFLFILYFLWLSSVCHFANFSLCGLVKIFKFEIATNQTIFQSRSLDSGNFESRLWCNFCTSCIIQQRVDKERTAPQWTHTHTNTDTHTECTCARKQAVVQAPLPLCTAHLVDVPFISILEATATTQLP